MDSDSDSIEEDGGVWVTVTIPGTHPSTKTKKCVPKGVYADANRAQCVTEYPDDVATEDVESPLEMELQEERFGDEEELDEIENHD
jgi:hypothetical protein